MVLILSHIRKNTRGNNMGKERVKGLEEGFKKRYNRDVEVHREVFRKDDKFEKVIADIVYGEDTYTLTEYFKEDQSTDYVTLDNKDKCHKYYRYVDAEIHMADLIGG